MGIPKTWLHHIYYNKTYFDLKREGSKHHPRQAKSQDEDKDSTN